MSAETETVSVSAAESAPNNNGDTDKEEVKSEAKMNGDSGDNEEHVETHGVAKEGEEPKERWRQHAAGPPLLVPLSSG